MKTPPSPPLTMSQLPQFVRLARDTDLMDARLMTFLTRNEQLLARAADEHIPVDARVQDHVLLLVVRATSHFRRDEVVSIAFPPRSVVGSNRLLKRICGVEEPHPSRMAVLFVADGEGYCTASELAPRKIASGRSYLDFLTKAAASAPPLGPGQTAYISFAPRRAGGHRP